ncbi:unnamed protein product [Triticum turgidum subsp. durum]|uniref:Inositol hexakisphosphate and diphosphoinositol-pentakisphosphate kinase n=1 Tax=Triticum turgidum subsp. durum TaxID=4567 RepID=A0A9R0RQW9_TRITD|nr:unnamed protein product [Triticum turgidum subsp. durum]
MPAYSAPSSSPLRADEAHPPVVHVQPPPRFSKLEFVTYDGTVDPLNWLNQCDQFFRGQRTLASDRTWIASYHLQGAAQTWYYALNQDEGGMPPWERSRNLCLLRFGPPIRGSRPAELGRLPFLTSVQDFADRFQALACHAPVVSAHYIEEDPATAGLGDQAAPVDVEHLKLFGVPVPTYAVVRREHPNQELNYFIEQDDFIEIHGKRFCKPFVEKPIDGDDHNIMIYYPSYAGGGMKELFRKVGNRSSEFYPEVRKVRRDGSYIYEEFMPTGGTDVKVYTIGPGYAHAEARKSPVVDGVVMRNSDGKEVRYPVLLTPTEKQIARNVCQAFRQAVCGFDLLRCDLGEARSYVCDVNGWSFVKSSYKYYDDAACILRKMFLDEKAPHIYTIPAHLPWRISEPAQPSDAVRNRKLGTVGIPTQSEELRCVIAVIRQ